MTVFSIIGITIAVIAVSAGLGRVFGKYVDLRREKFGQTAHKISGSMESLTGEIDALRQQNAELRSKIEQFEALVTSPAWDLLQNDREHTDTVEKTVGRSSTRTS